MPCNSVPGVILRNICIIMIFVTDKKVMANWSASTWLSDTPEQKKETLSIILNEVRSLMSLHSQTYVDDLQRACMSCTVKAPNFGPGA